MSVPRRAPPPPPPTLALLRHLDGIEAVMETHFGFEEGQLVSLLDGTDAGGLDKVAIYGAIA